MLLSPKHTTCTSHTLNMLFLQKISWKSDCYSERMMIILHVLFKVTYKEVCNKSLQCFQKNLPLRALCQVHQLCVQELRRRRRFLQSSITSCNFPNKLMAIYLRRRSFEMIAFCNSVHGCQELQFEPFDLNFILS